VVAVRYRPNTLLFLTFSHFLFSYFLLFIPFFIIVFVSHEQVINFYAKNDPYYQFTNFYPSPIYLHGKEWPTTEHYFQAMKFKGTPFEEEVRLLRTPRDAFNFPRTHRAQVREDWAVVKDGVMHEAVLAKFTQHEDLRRMLVDTGAAELVEHTENDSYWGDGGDGSGLNKLGKTLMQVRSKIVNRV
jgi:N-glycosidase YbiA